MVPEKYKLLVAGSGLSKVYFLFFSSIFVVFFEMLGIGLVPVFALIIVDTETSLLKISQFIDYPINLEMDKKQIIFISAIIFVLVFVVKNLVLV